MTKTNEQTHKQNGPVSWEIEDEDEARRNKVGRAKEEDAEDSRGGALGIGDEGAAGEEFEAAGVAGAGVPAGNAFTSGRKQGAKSRHSTLDSKPSKPMPSERPPMTKT